MVQPVDKWPNPSTVSALLANWFKVGDSVLVDNGSYQGKRAIVVGFGRRYIGRGGLTHKEAGVYIDFSVVKLAMQGDGGYKSLLADTLERLPGYSTHEQMRSVMIRLGGLTNAPLWEGDVVRYMGRFMTHEITHIDYCSPFHDQNIHSLRSLNGSCYSIRGSESLTLVSRGNIWKLEHGEKLDFGSIEEEAKFHQSLGMSKRVGFLHGEIALGGEAIRGEKKEFEFAEAIRLVKSGHAHQMKLGDKKNMTFVLIKYDDEAFGGRMQAHSLQRLGFNLVEEGWDVQV